MVNALWILNNESFFYFYAVRYTQSCLCSFVSRSRFFLFLHRHLVLSFLVVGNYCYGFYGECLLQPLSNCIASLHLPLLLISYCLHLRMTTLLLRLLWFLHPTRYCRRLVLRSALCASPPPSRLLFVTPLFHFFFLLRYSTFHRLALHCPPDHRRRRRHHL